MSAQSGRKHLVAAGMSASQDFLRVSVVAKMKVPGLNRKNLIIGRGFVR